MEPEPWTPPLHANDGVLLSGGSVPLQEYPVEVHPEKATPEPGVQVLAGLPGVDEREIRGTFEKHGLLERFDELKRAIAGART